MLRFVVWYLIALVIALPLNLVPLRTLLRLYPRTRPAIFAGATLGSLLWIIPPFLLGVPSTAFTRVVRAVIGPLWCGWTAWLLVEWIALAAIVLLWLPFARRVTFARFAKPLVTFQLAAMSVVIAIGCYQALVPVRVENVPITIANLPPQLRGMRIALMSDLHVGLFSRPSRLRQFADVAQSLHPDVYAISGDLVDDDPEYTTKLLKAFEALPSDKPLIAVLGNHEMYGDPRAVIKRLKGSHIQLLVNEAHAIEHNGAQLFIVGLSDFAASRFQQNRDLAPDLPRALRNVPRGATRILLAHQPKAFMAARQQHIPLTLVGHTHGGQFAIRPLHWTLAGVFLPFDMGLYRRGDAQLYVNTGTGFWMLPFRFGITPEITLVELR